MIKSSIALQKAQEIIDWFSLEYPLNLSDFCVNLDIKIEEEAIRNDGYLCCVDGLKSIFVKAGLHRLKKRFVIAHELGHYFMHDKKTIFGCKDIRENFNYRQNVIDTEREANAFASELLIPQRGLTDYLKNMEITVDLVKRISAKFDSSLTSTAFKCVEHSPSEGELLIYYRNNAKSWYVSNGLYYSDAYNVPPLFSLANEYFTNGFCKERSRVISGDYWEVEGRVYEGLIEINSNEAIVLLSLRH